MFSNITDISLNISITGIILMVLLSLFIFLNYGINIKNNILVFKTTLKDEGGDAADTKDNSLKQILFKKDEIDNKNKQLNLITIPNKDKESFDKNSVKNFFKKQFSQYLHIDDNAIKDKGIEDSNIEGPYFYNKEAHVYYINITLNKSLLNGKGRLDNNYRLVDVNYLKDYNKNKNNYNKLEYKYNENVLPILFQLNDDYLE
jgi:hypothetical protein